MLTPIYFYHPHSTLNTTMKTRIKVPNVMAGTFKKIFFIKNNQNRAQLRQQLIKCELILE